ncbi:MAG: MlaD family protein [Chlamydiota bacterium]
MREQTRNMLIGIFVIIACALIVWLILFLKPAVGDGKQTLFLRFSNINRINVGTRVLFAGKPVGEVVAIDEIYDAREKPQRDDLGQIYYYQLTLKIDSHIKVYNTDEFTIQTSGLLGEKSIAIIPKTPPKGITPRQITTQPVNAESVDPLENAFNDLSSLAKKMQQSFDKINVWIDKNGDSLGEAICSFKNAMNEVDTAVHSINDLKLIPDIQLMVRNATSTICDIKDAIRQLNEGKVFVNAGEMICNFKDASHSINLISKNIASGKGTLGKLINCDELYYRMSAVMSKADTLMNDVNHYGILFHLNKSWQRQRLQKITELNALNTPKGFKNYFEGEVDEINTAMARISMLIERAQTSPEKETILSNDQFRKDFAELLRQSEELSDNLKLYNQQLNKAVE